MLIINIDKEDKEETSLYSNMDYRWTKKKINPRNRPRNQNIETNTETNLTCLLWMDDVLLLETRPEENQELLNITNKVAEIYHIEFGREKAKQW